MADPKPVLPPPDLPKITRPSGPGNVFDETAQRIARQADTNAAGRNGPAPNVVPVPSFLDTTPPAKKSEGS